MSRVEKRARDGVDAAQSKKFRALRFGSLGLRFMIRITICALYGREGYADVATRGYR